MSKFYPSIVSSGHHAPSRRVHGEADPTDARDRLGKLLHCWADRRHTTRNCERRKTHEAASAHYRTPSEIAPDCFGLLASSRAFANTDQLSGPLLPRAGLALACEACLVLCAR